MIKIGLCGTHGSGKSTLSSRLAYCYHDLGKTVCVVEEVARNCPHPLRTVKAQEWIWAEQMRREKQAMAQDVDVIICDRTVMDNLMYYFDVCATIQYRSHEESEHFGRWNELYREAQEWLPTYTHIIRLPLNLGWLQADDPIRPKDVDYARRIDRLFDRFVDSYVTDTFI